jgi:hydrogenase maturation protease
VSERRASVVVIGVGNELRGDDGAGIEVARRVRELVDPRHVAVLEQHGEALGLIEQWDGYSAALIVDAIGAGAPAGSLRRVDASREPLPADLRSSTSTHAVGVGETIELARAIGRLPQTLVLHGVQGEIFDTGSELSRAVRAAIGPLTEIVYSDAELLT